MKYEIMFYAGLAGAGVTLLITIIAFFKCNVIENVQDLLGGKLKKSTSKASNNRAKDDSKKEKPNKEKSKKAKSSNGSRYIDNEGETREFRPKGESVKVGTNNIESIKGKSEIVEATKHSEDNSIINGIAESEVAATIENNKANSTNVLGNKGNKMYYDPENNDNNEESKQDEDEKKYNNESCMSNDVDPDSTGILEEVDPDVTGILDEEDPDVTRLLDEEDDCVTELLDEEDEDWDATDLLDEDDGFNEVFVKEIDITITHIDMEI